jgi:hypothetical protein
MLASVGPDSQREPPRPESRRGSYSEQTNEASKLLKDEPVEVERERPLEDNPSIERAEPHHRPSSPLFEEE